MSTSTSIKTRAITYGKLRGLQACADDKGVFSILALDHRGELRKAMGVEGDANATFANIAAFKRQVVADLAECSSAFLLDPDFGVGPCIAHHALPGHVGLIVTTEASGYEGPSHARVSRLPAHWGVEPIKRLGASAAKLLVYYHPDSPTAPAMRKLVADVAADCDRLDLPLFLETLSYSIDPANKNLTSAQRIDIAIRTAAELTPIGGDVYKAEFPLDVVQTPDDRAWADACRALTEACVIPWVLLSAGVSYEVFAHQTRVACAAGASGVLAGRAIWKEAASLTGEQRTNFLETTALGRMHQLREICRETARPFCDYYATPDEQPDWHVRYHGSIRA